MKVNGKHHRTVWADPQSPGQIFLIDQRKLPHKFEIEKIGTVEELCVAIKEMHVRGAPAIGVAAAYGMYLASLQAKKEKDPKTALQNFALMLKSTRPTAINLAWAVDRVLNLLLDKPAAADQALSEANKIADQDVECCRMIGEYGVKLIEALASKDRGIVNVMTHCNAGWLATVDYGTATAPIYLAAERGIPIHVWVSETRPRNQGALLTAWELAQQRIPHTLIADNAAGILMQKKRVDLVLVGSDRTTFTGDVANKIGTYLKALSAKANNLPFYVALPSSSIDWSMEDGVAAIPIEERNADELRFMEGVDGRSVRKIRITSEDSPVLNPAFDVTPRELVTALITERGVCAASREGVKSLFPERFAA